MSLILGRTRGRSTARRPSRRGRLLVERAHVRELRRLAELAYPFEGCGLLIGEPAASSIRASGRAPSLRVRWIDASRNVRTWPESRRRFEVHPEDVLRVERAARARGLRLVGVWHSHPDHPAEPSAVDRLEAWPDLSFLIVSVDRLGETVMRSFRRRGGALAPEILEIVHR
ncbi:MAG: M67 family metallopeptidase [Acidobacteriota bacterium]